jgi:3-dehydroquinate dehydratase-2
MPDTVHRIEVLHGVNLDMLGRRDPALYGTLTLPELQQRIEGYAAELGGLRLGFFQSNFEGELVQRLHRLRGEADGVLINAGAWSHYAWALRDALEVAACPAIEVHLSDVAAREPWRRVSIFDGLVLASFSGQGAEGYRVALTRLRHALDGGGAGAPGIRPTGSSATDGER